MLVYNFVRIGHCFQLCPPVHSHNILCEPPFIIILNKKNKKVFFPKHDVLSFLITAKLAKNARRTQFNRPFSFLKCTFIYNNLTSSADPVREFAANGSVLLSPIRPLPPLVLPSRSRRTFRYICL